MSQSLSQLWVHIIFSTKKRQPFLKDFDTQERIYDYISATCRNLQCNVIAIGGVQDHVHLLVNLNKNIALSDLVEKIKKSSSKWIKTLNDQNSDLNDFYWQRGYGAFSVSQSNLDTVKKYVLNQKAHHMKRSFQDEFRKFLIHYGITYKEEYVWD
ncbi:MAG: IS200/IS605 family transposase [Legionellales bacterium]|jgi:REP element-mobilizing transposase RayT